MGHFEGNITLDPLKNGREFLVLTPLWYHCVVDGVEHHILVRPGMSTDMRSGSDLIDPIVPKWGVYGDAVLVHDTLYEIEYMDSRSLCDRIFLEAMCDTLPTTPWWRRNLMWSAVRSAGWTVWNRHDPENVKLMRAEYEEAKKKFPYPLCEPSVNNQPYIIGGIPEELK